MTARAGRQDLSAMLKISSVPSDEPVFLLRAQDAVGAEAVRAWAQLARAAGAPVPVVEQALQQADAMAAWPVKKVPDADHLSEAEQKRLTYKHTRRAWEAREEVPDERTALAEHRGFNEGAGLIRALHEALEQLAPTLDWRICAAAPNGVAPDKTAYAELIALRDLVVLPTLQRAEARRGRG